MITEAFFENEPKYFKGDDEIELLVSELQHYEEIVIATGKRITAKSGGSLYAITEHEIRSGEIQNIAKNIIGSSFFSVLTTEGVARKEFKHNDIVIEAECFIDNEKIKIVMLNTSLKTDAVGNDDTSLSEDISVDDSEEIVSIDEDHSKVAENNETPDQIAPEDDIIDMSFDDENENENENDSETEVMDLDDNDNIVINFDNPEFIEDIDNEAEDEEGFNANFNSFDTTEEDLSTQEDDSSEEQEPEDQKSEDPLEDRIEEELKADESQEIKQENPKPKKKEEKQLSLAESLDIKFSKFKEEKDRERLGTGGNNLDTITGMKIKRDEDTPYSEYLLEDEPIRFTGMDNSKLKRLLLHMAKFDASGLFIKGGDYIWMSVQGRKRRVSSRKITNNEAKDLLNIAYNANTASVTIQQQKPLNFAYQMIHPESQGGRLRFRVNAVSNTTDNTSSMTITFRLIQTIPPTIEQLKIPMDIVKACEENDKGIIYVAGATGQGKSTTLASIMRYILEKEDAHVNMVDIGEPIEYTMDLLDLPSSFVTSLNVGSDISSFSKAVENCMRMEPQIIQISESRDIDTIEASLRASKSGHGVYTTIHSGSVAESLRRIINMFPADTRDSVQLDVIESTKMIIAQKLIETVDGKRMAIREYLIFTPEVREHLWNAQNIGQKAIEMVERFGHPMTKDLDAAFEKGLISEEVYTKRRKDYDNEVNATKRDNA